MNQRRELYNLTLDVLRLYRYACIETSDVSEGQNLLQQAFDLTQFVIKNAQNDTSYQETREHIIHVKQTLEYAKPLSIVYQNTRSVSRRLADIPDDVDARQMERAMVILFERNHIDSHIRQKCLTSNERTAYLSPLSTGYLIFSIVASMYTSYFPKSEIIVHPMALSKERDRAVCLPLPQDAVRVVVIDDVIDSGDTMRAAVSLAEEHFPNIPVYPGIHQL